MYIYGQKIVCLVSELWLKYCCLLQEGSIKMMQQKVRMQLLLTRMYTIELYKNCRVLSIVCVLCLVSCMCSKNGNTTSPFVYL